MIPLLIILIHYNERLIPSFSKRWICYLIVTVYTTATTYITGTEIIIKYETVQKKRDEDILETGVNTSQKFGLSESAIELYGFV